ncbi:MAG: dephospho-CoA kinase [Planctomycetes bacterium]|nr:dephospho-CoA kinase [Planctomycetota bacterium]
MDNPGKKPIIGILGGIASGKSTVAAEFAKLGCKIIDADEIAHELLDEPNVRSKIISYFGNRILGPEGKIDRNKLGDMAFSDAVKLSELNNIIHPVVLEQTEELIERYTNENEVRGIVLDMPLLVEVGWVKRCDRVIFVECSEQVRGDRAKKMGIYDEKQFKIRENFQISLDNKTQLSDNTVDNNSDFSDLTKQVTEIFSHIVANK